MNKIALTVVIVSCSFSVNALAEIKIKAEALVGKAKHQQYSSLGQGFRSNS